MSKSKDEKNPKNLFKRGDSWILDFYYRGERYTENLGPASRTVAKEIRDRRKGAAAAGKLEFGPKIEDLLFEKACGKYLEWYKANSRQRSYERHETSAIPLKAAFSGKCLSQISAFAIEKYKLDRKAAKKADATVNRELTMLKHLFSKCVKWKLAKSSPMQDVSFYKENNGRVRYLTEDEASRLLAACNPDFRIVVLAAMMTGFRRSELRSLRWINVDFVNGSITVESGYSKNGETGTVPMNADLAKALKTLHEERKPAPDDPVFVNRYNKPWTSWRTAFENAVERAGLKDFRFHDCRHCFGSWLAKNGTDIKARMELMRHKTPAMTLRYSHLSVEYKRQAIAELPSFASEMESQQISQQVERKKVIAFDK